MSRKTPKRMSVERARRAEQALQLRESGHTYRHIATTLGVSVRTAHNDVQDAIASITRESAEHVRVMELDRYDRLLEAVWPKAVAGNIKAVHCVLNVMARIDKLHGIDKPRESDGVEETHSMLSLLLENSMKRIGMS